MTEYVYIIKELWIDSMEDNYRSALGYEEICCVLSEAEAKKIVEEAGVSVGTGWPIDKGESKPKKIFVKLPLLEVKND